LKSVLCKPFFANILSSLQGMGTMSRALIFALIVGMATAALYEWKGVFYTPDNKYMWGAEKVDGKYADPTMTLAAIPVTEATKGALAGASGKATAALSSGCEAVQKGGTITPQENKCYKLMFDQTSDQTLFTVDAAGTKGIAFFAQHFPTEFEATEHYFKDDSGVDIEPVAQEPEQEGGHGHGHGGGEGSFEGVCVCQAKENNWKLDCTNKAKIENAVAELDKNSACKAADPPKDCIDHYYVMQAHHDHCLHDSLPTDIEKKLHAYEHFYSDCFVKRQFDPDLTVCPKVDCNDATAMTQAIATLQAGCTTSAACADSECAKAVKIVLMAHDTCSEDLLPNNLETALHDHEEPCEAQLCNTAEEAFDPYAASCEKKDGTEAKDVSAASGFASQKGFLVTIGVASCGVLISS